jgi:Tfp pilus tip-associated adhesin PilY1
MANGQAWDRNDLVDEVNDDQGWTFLLKSPNEKVLATANVFNRVVFFTTFTPTTVEACGTGGGTAKLYAVQMDTGFAAINFSTGEELVDSNDRRVRRVTVGSGIASMPVIVITYPASGDAVATVQTSVVTATTNQELRSNPAPPPSTLKQILYWREVPTF